MNYERCHEFVVRHDLLLESVEHELRGVVGVGSLQDVARSIRLELSFLEVHSRTNEMQLSSRTFVEPSAESTAELS